MGGASGRDEFEKAPKGDSEERTDIHAGLPVLPEETDGFPVLQTELLLSDCGRNREGHGHIGREPCRIAAGWIAFGILSLFCPFELAHGETEKLALCLGYTL